MPSSRTRSRLVTHLYQALCLVVLMIAGQQGAVVHELRHLTGVQGVDLRAATGELSDAACALCPAFAQVATPAFSHSFSLPSLVRVDVERVAEPRLETAETSVPTPRSRGPPSQS